MVNSYVSYDQQSRSISVNSRLRWTFTPLGDLFVVYDHNLDEFGDRLSPHRRWGFASN